MCAWAVSIILGDVMRRRRWIIAVGLLLLAAIAALLFFLWYKGAPRVIDNTTARRMSGDATPETAETAGGTQGGAAGENEIVLNPSVNLLLEEEAQAINDSITQIYCNEEEKLEISLDTPVQESFGGLGSGDLFYLDGDENSPLGGPYIGRIDSVTQTDEGSLVVVDTPYMDEVFDQVNLDISEDITQENMTSISALDGVQVYYADDALAGAADSQTPQASAGTVGFAGAETGSTQITYLGKSSASRTAFEELGVDVGAQDEEKGAKGSLQVGKDLVVEYDVDILNFAQKVQKKPEADVTPVKDENLAEGRDYWNESTAERVKNDLIDSINSDKNVIRVHGKSVLSDVHLDLQQDFDISKILDSDRFLGMKNFSYDLSYQSYMEHGITINISNLEVGGTKNELDIKGIAKLQGLRDKLWPLACIQYSVGTPVTFTVATMSTAQINNAIHFSSSVTPLSAALILYADATGAVTAKVELGFTAQQNFANTHVYVRDGKWVNQDENVTNEKEYTWMVNAGIAADMDINAGVAVDVYVFNVSIVDVNMLKLGLDCSGLGGFRVDSSDPIDGSDLESVKSHLYGDMYARLYLKILDVNLRMSLTVGSDAFLGWDTEKHWTIEDLTLWQFGTARGTTYDAQTMSMGQVTAQDENYLYYLDERGSIRKQNKETGMSTVIYSGTMSIFCGIDDSYLYILRPSTLAYEICRVDKVGSAARVMQNDVAAVLNQDKNYLYYLSSQDQSKIMALNRSTGNSVEFADFDDSVQVMISYGSYYYVTTRSDSPFAAFLSDPSRYYLLDSEGTVLSELGGNPDPLNLPRGIMQNYYYASKYVTRQLLRFASSQTVYWISADQSNVVETEQVSGWNTLEAGIFVTLANEEGAEKPFSICLYDGVTGTRTKVVDVDSDQAFFTLCQDAAGGWYFFDEDLTHLTLYHMNGDFSGLTVIKQYEKSDLGVSLDECAMEIIGNKLVFYSISEHENSQTAKTLYRYDVL